MNKEKLSNILEIKYGKDTKKLASGNIPAYGSSGIVRYVNSYIYDEESILIARKGSLNNIFYTEKPFWAIDTMFYTIINKTKVFPKYLYYFLKLRNLDILDVGSTIPSLTVPILNDIEIILPSINKQKNISNILNLFDRKISNNNKIISKLESIAKTIYDYWFVQFDFPNDDNKPYKKSGGEMVYSKELGRYIPKDWEVGNFYSNNIFELVKVGVDKFHTKIYLATSDVEEHNIRLGKKIQYDNREKRANMQPKINTVWFAKMKNTVKHLFLNKEMKHIINNTILSTGFFGLQCNEISFEYISSVITDENFENRKNFLSHGATQQAINQEDLKEIKFLIPDIEILTKFHNITKSIYGDIGIKREENQKLAEIRDFLLPLLMNGQAYIE